MEDLCDDTETYEKIEMLIEMLIMYVVFWIDLYGFYFFIIKKKLTTRTCEVIRQTKHLKKTSHIVAVVV